MKRIPNIILTAVLFFGIKTTPAQTLLDSLQLKQAPIYESLEDALKEPEKVYRLDLRKKKLAVFPMDILKFPNLQELDLSKNKLKEIPEEIGQLTNLQILNLSKNQLELLPKAIGNLINLKVLIVNQNELTALPVQIGDLINLKYLDLWSNNISFWPEQLANLKNLKTMDCRVIMINSEKQNYIQSLLPNTKIYFSPDCKCGG